MSMKSIESQRKAVENVANDIERKHGSVELLKICFSATNKTLVESGVISETDLHRNFLLMVRTFQQRLKDHGENRKSTE